MRLLTPGEAARVLGVTRQGVLWLVQTRRLRARRTVGGKWIITSEALRELLRQREAAGARTARSRRGAPPSEMAPAGTNEDGAAT
jgi:excisionase family DNA binding protein